MENKNIYFIKYLEEVRGAYKKYIGEKSLYLLNCYLNGFSYNTEGGGSILPFEDDETEIKKKKNVYFDFDEVREFFISFQRWIEQRYSYQWQSWSNIIRFHCDNEEEVFETFYNELRLFCEQTKK